MIKVGDKIKHRITGESSLSTKEYDGVVIGVYPRFYRVQFDVNGRSIIECFPLSLTRAPKQKVMPF